MVVAGFKHILLLEPQMGFRQLIHEELEEMGYRVTSAVSATAARSTLAHGDVDLLIADIPRAGEDAHGVAEAAAATGCRCVLISRVREVRDSFDEDTAKFFDKSFTLEQLANKVTEVLDSAPKIAG